MSCPGEAQLPRRHGSGAYRAQDEERSMPGRQVSIVNLFRRGAVAAVLTVLAAGCGSSPAPLTRSPTTTAPPPTTTAPVTASAIATQPATAPSGHQKITVTPAVGLKSGQKVLVQASGFSPAESLVVTECAAKGTATGPGDCDLNGMQSMTSDASGRVKVDLTVTRGPFGANNIVCGPAQACLISVTQAIPSPTQEADTSIAFGLSGHAHRCRAAERSGHGRGRSSRSTACRPAGPPLTHSSPALDVGLNPLDPGPGLGAGLGGPCHWRSGAGPWSLPGRLAAAEAGCCEVIRSGEGGWP